MPIIDDTPQPEPLRWQVQRVTDYQLVRLLAAMIRLHGEDSRQVSEVRREMRERKLIGSDRRRIF